MKLIPIYFTITMTILLWRGVGNRQWMRVENDGFTPPPTLCRAKIYGLILPSIGLAIFHPYPLL